MNAITILQRRSAASRKGARVKIKRASLLMATGPVRIDPVQFEVSGPPKGKARARVTMHGTYTPAGTVAYEGRVRGEARLAMKNARPFEGPLFVLIRAEMPIPKSWPRYKRESAAAGYLLPTVKPDGDNIAKITFDALNHTAWGDDSQVVDFEVKKVYGHEPRLIVLIKPFQIPQSVQLTSAPCTHESSPVSVPPSKTSSM